MKSTLDKIIKEVVKEEISLFEKAKTVADVRKEKLALMIASENDKQFYILYDPKKALLALNDEAGDTREYNFVYGDFDDELYPTILAMIRLVDNKSYGKNAGNAYGTKMVAYSAAKNKYGPLIYDIALSINQKAGLTADRGGTSRSARKVWNYYATKRKDVISKPLDNIAEPKTKTKKDDSFYQDPETPENPVNRAYWIKKPVNYKALLKNNEVFVKKASEILQKKLQEYWSSGPNKKKIKVTPKSIEKYLRRAAEAFFEENYSG